MRDDTERAALVIVFVCYCVFACACALTVIAPEAYRYSGTISGTPTAQVTDTYQSFIPYHAYEDRATPTRIDLRTPTPRATATRFTGTRPPTWTPYP